MKKFFKNTLFIISVTFLIIVSASCKANKEDEDMSVSKNDLSLKINHKDIFVDSDVTGAIELLGQNYIFEEGKSCAYEGMDKAFSYNDISISTLPIDGKDIICEMYVTGNQYETSKGIKVGQKKSDIENAHGKNYTFKDGVLTYWFGENENPKTPKLYFLLDNEDTIIGLSVFNGKNSGE